MGIDQIYNNHQETNNRDIFLLRTSMCGIHAFIPASLCSGRELSNKSKCRV